MYRGASVLDFGAMLAQPRGPDPGWDATCRRLLATYLAGLGAAGGEGCVTRS